MAFLSNSPGLGWYTPPPEVFALMPEPLPRVDPRELDEWLASVLGPDSADPDHETERDHG